MEQTKNLYKHGADDLARLLAVLIANQDSYTHVDKLSNTPSKELALFYIREALRDYNSFLSKKIEDKKIIEEIKKISLKNIEDYLGIFSELSSRELREITSLISAKALAIAARIKEVET
ncbi:MAG: type I-A CRISPR-associated protein Csa5 [Candidatus Odinarchaeum yellowstonii]|uniref:Type I-A CRISPR-associated protein Csa5 n=1 Tax=Odinarchaeota yellowstonii (strain LCB_4) TaxID=1841599 RepID=A0AAF0IBE8_ODILC|nr:MAG: type I-A CRISPR-associated protein Csa5 [Candidatus Odinarchaeum yellowstonii]